jgi:hypothetical protein
MPIVSLTWILLLIAIFVWPSHILTSMRVWLLLWPLPLLYTTITILRHSHGIVPLPIPLAVMVHAHHGNSNNISSNNNLIGGAHGHVNGTTASDSSRPDPNSFLIKVAPLPIDILASPHNNNNNNNNNSHNDNTLPPPSDDINTTVIAVTGMANSGIVPAPIPAPIPLHHHHHHAAGHHHTPSAPSVLASADGTAGGHHTTMNGSNGTVTTTNGSASTMVTTSPSRASGIILIHNNRSRTKIPIHLSFFYKSFRPYIIVYPHLM